MWRIFTFVASIAFLSAFSPAVRAQSPYLVPRGSEQPSFDCAQAKTATARLICADGELARLDGELGVAFQKRKSQLAASDQTKFVAGELSWIRDRNQRCGLVGTIDATIEELAASKPCLLSAIRERIAFLDHPGSLQAGAPVVDCNHPQNAGDADLCRQVSGNRAPPTAPQKEEGPAAAACDNYAAEAIPFEQINPGLAIPACESAVQQYPNSARLIFELGRAYHKYGDFNSAAAFYQQAADQGFAAAETGLGFLYDNGQGVPQDYVQAMLWYRKAADQGYSGAQYDVALMYANGHGVAQDYSQAAAWYRKAADQGFALAQNNLGVLYENGQGVTQDYEQALAWYSKAADQGVKKAESNLASLKPKIEINEKLSKAKQQGYQPESFEDFKLDGKQLAATNAKLIIQGVYEKFGEVETLQPSGLAVAFARQYDNDNGIPLLTDDATRNIRKFFLECGDNPGVPLGCPVTVIGHADMCTNLLGTNSAPCLAVEDGW